jgi:tetratricopeptide (TPR) repeat protein
MTNSNKLNLNYLHKTIVGKHWIKIYAPNKDKISITTWFKRIGLFFSLVLAILFINNQYYHESTKNWFNFMLTENEFENHQPDPNEFVQPSQENSPSPILVSPSSQLDVVSESQTHKQTTPLVRTASTIAPHPNEKHSVAKIEDEVKTVQTTLNPISHYGEGSPKLASTSVVQESSLKAKNEIVALLQQCENYFKTDLLATETPKIAANCYVLVSEPNNTQAQIALKKKIEAHYQSKIEQFLIQENRQKAHQYLEHLRQINPNAALLSKLQLMLEKKSSSKISENDARLTGLLEQCQAHFKANRLTTGKGGTAFECYQKVLTLEPKNAQAIAGLKQIEIRYQHWAERALKKRQWQKARKHIHRLRRVNPRSPVLPKLFNRLKRFKPKSQPRTSASPQISQRSKKSQLPPPKKAQAPKKAPQSSSQRAASALCGDILAQESLGIRPLTRKQREFKRQHCN